MSINVLSLFDGMSCGQLALKRAKIPVKNYYASEIDDHSIKITLKNFPKTYQLGDVNNILDLYKNKKFNKIDLLIAGSPCQGFSYAGKRLNFEDPRSKLFFIFAEILKTIKPKYFLLENVLMEKSCEDIITNYLKVQPILINSGLITAQARRRLYWTNISFNSYFKNKNIFIKDILQKNIKIDKTKKFKLFKTPKKSKLNLIRVGEKIPFGKFQSENRIYSINGKSPTLTARQDRINIQIKENFRRYFTPIEAERLQTVPDNYTKGVPKTQRFKMLGNGWTIDVIKQIFEGMKENKTEYYKSHKINKFYFYEQLQLF
jgi:DNA (cytosine-5)-methyltransferase 3A